MAKKFSRRNDTSNNKFNFRVNEQIRVPEIRLVGDNLEEIANIVGQNIEPGTVYPTRRAKEWAEEAELDLVEISPNAKPPVVKIIDYNKFLYERKKKEKEIKAKAAKTVVKEIRFGPNTDDHDFDFKLRHAKKFLEEGAKVVTVSDSSGTVVDEDGFTTEKLAELSEVKNHLYGRVDEYARRVKATFLPDTKPWHIPVDVALPCATQNEISEEDAKTLVKNGVICVAEGANMPSTAEAVECFEHNGVLYAPGKASNAGGVATSGLEMSQHAMRLSWTHEEVDARLLEIMQAIHRSCLQYGTKPDGRVNYVDGANIAGFVKVADAMLGQGVT